MIEEIKKEGKKVKIRKIRKRIKVTEEVKEDIFKKDNLKEIEKKARGKNTIDTEIFKEKSQRVKSSLQSENRVNDKKKSVISIIVDTNIFLQNPYILDEFKNSKKYNIIIPRKVIDELDGLKKNVINKKNAYEAIRSIDQAKANNSIMISASFTELLSDDFDPHSADNIIMSVVLKYNGILLTNDRGFKLKAESLKLKVYDVESFLNIIKTPDKVKTNKKLNLELFDSIKNNDINRLKELINNSLTNVNFLDNKGFTPLIVAVRGRKYNAVKILLKDNNIDIDKVDKSRLKMTPFSYATQKKDLKMMEILYSKGAKVYLGVKGKNEGNTPLLIAAWDGCLKCIKFILDTGDVSINSVDNNGFTALIKVAIKGYYDIAEYLIDKNADTMIRDKKHKRAIDYAKEKGHYRIIELLQGEK